MFFGQHHISLDDQRHLVIPPHFTKLLSGGAFIIQGFERNLWVMSAETFKEICQQVIRMNIADPQTRLLLRMILGTACQLDIDESGQVSIPNNLSEYAVLSDEVVLVGQGDYFEIWSPEFWKKQEIRVQDAESNAQRFATLDLAKN